jgi:hypothetical protein
MPLQPTLRTATLAGHWVPNHNNGRLAVDVEGDRCGDGVYRCVSPYLRRSLRPLRLYGCSVVVSVPSSEQVPPLCTCVLNSTCRCLKNVLHCVVSRRLSMSGRRLWPMAANAFSLRYAGMHSVPQSRDICAFIVARVIIMGRCARGVFGLRGGEQ